LRAFAHELVDGSQKCGQGLAGAGGSGYQYVFAGLNGRPCAGVGAANVFANQRATAG
jgi:hypothetical protein